MNISVDLLDLHRENDFSLINLFYKRTYIMVIENYNLEMIKTTNFPRKFINMVHPRYDMVTMVTNLFNAPALR